MSTQRSPQPESVPEVSLKWRLAIALEFGKVSLSQMAEAIGYSETQTRNFLKGRQEMRSGTLAAWALRCGVPYEWLRDGVEPNSGPDTPSDQGIPPSPCNADTAKVLKFREAAPTKSARPKAA